MNKNKFMVASLLILIGMGAITVSCEKHKVNTRKAQIILDNNIPKTGDDDDDPIIHGKVKKKVSLAAVGGAKVVAIAYGTNDSLPAVFTDSLGEFTQQVKKGIYFFKVNVPGVSSPYITDTFSVNQNTSLTILVD